MYGCWTVWIRTAKLRATTRARRAALALVLAALGFAATPARAEGWLSVAIVHPEFEEAARAQGIERRAKECVVRPADPADREPGEPALLHCVEILTHQPEAFFAPGFVVVGAGPFPGRPCIYAYLHGWLYQNDFLAPRLVEVRTEGFYNVGREAGPRNWIESPVCR